MARRPLAGAAFIIAASLASAGAPAAVVAWPAYIMSGPGYEYQAIDETERGDLIVVLGCDKGWCAIDIGRKRGYVPRTTLADAGSPTDWSPRNQAGSASCFLAEVPVVSGKRAERFCPDVQPAK